MHFSVRFAFLAGLAGLTGWAETFDAFTFSVPTGWTVQKTADWAAVKREAGGKYCDSFLIPMQASTGSHKNDVENAWRIHAAKHGLVKPESAQSASEDGWEVTTGAGTATVQKLRFTVVVSTRTGQGRTYSIVHYFNDNSFAEAVGALMKSVVVNAVAPAPAPGGMGMLMTKFNTNFDDGWKATAQGEFVQVTKASTEVQLHYVNEVREKGRPNTVGPAEYYWSQAVTPFFQVGPAQVWAGGVSYPPVYFIEANAVDKRSGKPCHVALKVIYAGGARVVVAVSPNQAAYRQQFGHPNDFDKMLVYNKFAVTAKDMVGSWSANTGGGVEYYNAYTGNYAGMIANSTTDEFLFQGDGAYQSKHRFANTTNGASRFSGLDYQGRYTVSDWEVLATNRVGGKTKKFWAQLEAIKNGYVLILTDSDYEPLRYVLVQKR